MGHKVTGLNLAKRQEKEFVETLQNNSEAVW